MTTHTELKGFCHPNFEEAADGFAQNFAERGEVGASFCCTLEGETVVDLWAGTADPATGAPWQEDTLSVVFSCTKAATALCAHILIDRGIISPDEKVAAYWPEFAQNGKDAITVAMLLNHTAGLPALREPVKPGGFADWDYMCRRFAEEEVYWTPGATGGYHMTSFGWLVGEVVRRVSGISLGAFFRREVADPLGLDFWIGLPETEEPRVAPITLFSPGPDTPKTDFVEALLSDRNSIQFLSLFNTGAMDANSRAAHAAELGGHGGIANARALAGMYASLANPEDASNIPQMLSPRRINALRRVSAESSKDANLLIPTRFGEGFMLSMDNRATTPGEGNSVILADGTFGHVGMGGSIGIADPDRRLSMGYTMNKLGGGLLLNNRGQTLIDALYCCL